MKSFLLCLLFPTSVFAQEYTNTLVDKPNGWYVVGGNSRAADVFELGAMTHNGDITLVRSVLYLTRSEDLGYGNTDYVVSANEFDCRTTGRYRVISEQYFAEDTPDPLFESGPDQWRQDTDPKTVGVRLWSVVCGNVRDESVFPVVTYVGKTAYSHTDVLNKVRQQARAAGY